MARVLFASAPFGSFFRACATSLLSQGHQVWRVAWDGGDAVETPARHRVLYTPKFANYGSFLEQVVRDKHISVIVAYNDVGDRNRAALQLARRLGLAYYILEQGYLRPHWVTLDRHGVNGNACLPKSLDFYADNYAEAPAPERFPCRMRSHVLSAFTHFLACLALSPVLPFDPNYYGDSLYVQAKGYASEYIWRKSHFEQKKVAEITKHKAQGRPLFGVILQKPGDAQLRIHSRYASSLPFLEETLQSFAAHAPDDAILVVKQHPLDYGIERMPVAFQQLVEKHGLNKRAFYLRKTSFEIFLDNVTALITVNSTAGLAAVQRGMAVKCSGSAIYDMAGLTFQGSIDAFWRGGVSPDPKAVEKFISYLYNYSQVNGSLYAPRGIVLASRALADIISSDFYAPHSLLKEQSLESWLPSLRVPQPVEEQATV